MKLNKNIIIIFKRENEDKLIYIQVGLNGINKK